MNTQEGGVEERKEGMKGGRKEGMKGGRKKGRKEGRKEGGRKERKERPAQRIYGIFITFQTKKLTSTKRSTCLLAACLLLPYSFLVTCFLASSL